MPLNIEVFTEPARSLLQKYATVCAAINPHGNVPR